MPSAGALEETLVNSSCLGSFESFTGCSFSLFLTFLRLQDIILQQPGSAMSRREFHTLIRDLRGRLMNWKSPIAAWSRQDPDWYHLQDAYRWSFLLYSFRALDWFHPPDSSTIKQAVQETLDSVSLLLPTADLARRTVFPLFMAGTDALAPHQQEYISQRLKAVRNITGFRNLAVSRILERVWTDRRARNADEQGDITWFDIVGFPVSPWVIHPETNVVQVASSRTNDYDYFIM